MVGSPVFERLPAFKTMLHDDQFLRELEALRENFGIGQGPFL
jgi:hypothetical protein